MKDSLADNTMLSHYRILSLLGAGGMGEVYLAEDTQLERQVALKVLRAEIADDEERVRRFIQEAKAASALNHPNILTVYEIGHFENLRFIATELIKGETLSRQLRSEPMSLKSTLEIAIQIASALQAAHDAGIVHRDIKPENVMIRPDGFVKLLDFGIAKLTEKKSEPIDEEAATAIKSGTSPGMIVGTARYMSPEQARGRQVDARTDIFSFGVVLYEMLTVRHPFEGENAMDVIGSILHKEPAPIRQLLPAIPQDVERLINKTLRKDREERYQTAKDLLIDLKDARQELEVQSRLERTSPPNREEPNTQIITATTADVPHTTSSAEYAVSEIRKHQRAFAVGLIVVLLALIGLGYRFFGNRAAKAKQIESIAVMPFVNASANADAEYLSDGMTETLISSLSLLPNLNVKARSSVFRYKGKETTAQTICKELNVQAILSGRVVQRGDQLTLSLELVDAQTENVIWSEQYNRKQTDLVSLQNEIARDVSSKLRMKLSGTDEQKLSKKYTENTEAYKLYLQGRFYQSKRTANDTQKAVEHFQQAVAVDSTYALAYAGLADAYLFLTIYGDTPANEALPKARETVLKALALDNSLPEAHSALGAILFFQDRDITGWERETKRALELNPNFADGHRRNGLRFLWLGRFEEARAAFTRVLEIEPLSAAANLNYANCLFYSGSFDENDAQMTKTLELDPNFWYSHHHLFSSYRLKRKYASAVEELAKSQELRDEKAAANFIRESFTKGGWQEFLRTMTAERTRAKLSPYILATFHAELGEKDKAFAELEETYEKRDQLIYFMKIDMFLDPLRGDPRFQELLGKAGFPQ